MRRRQSQRSERKHLVKLDEEPERAASNLDNTERFVVASAKMYCYTACSVKAVSVGILESTNSSELFEMH